MVILYSVLLWRLVMVIVKVYAYRYLLATMAHRCFVFGRYQLLYWVSRAPGV
jgi:hypothetical protein